MSSEVTLTDEIAQYLKRHPLGCSKDELLAYFGDVTEKELDEALRTLESNGSVLAADGTWRWRGR